MQGKDSYIEVNTIRFCFFAIIVGVVTGFGALVFRYLISIVHNLFFYGEWALHYDDNQLSPLSPWGPFVILVPVVGGLIVVWMVKTFAPEARGHGVPEVMHAVYYKEGKMRPVVAVVKSLASALSIGSGASVGREGPIIQIGSSLGSTIGQIFKLVPWQRTTLLAAGAGAGIAATFNTPLGGVLFAIEILLLEISSRTFLPIVLATGVATYIGRIFVGLQPAFIVPIASFTSTTPMASSHLLAFMVFGVVCGVVSWLFIDCLSFMDKAFQKIKANDYVRNIIGMTIVGTFMYVLSLCYGHYFVGGVGYGTIQGILEGNMTMVSLLLLLAILKIFATTISLGAGASGGIFSPSLFIGACLGGAFGGILTILFPSLEFSIIQFAMVGMAAIIGGVTGAAVTAVVMIFEMTRDYTIMVPLIMAVGISIVVRQKIHAASIYTVKLLWRGLTVPETRHLNMFLVRHVKDVMDATFCTMDESTTLDDMLHTMTKNKHPNSQVLVTRNNKVVGTVPVSHVMRAAGGVSSPITLHEVMLDKFIKVNEEDIFHDVMKRLRSTNSNVALVVKHKNQPLTEKNILGLISKNRIIDSILDYFR